MYLFDALDVHRVVVLEEDDAHLPQAPPRQLLDLWRDICSQGGCADEEPVLPHRPAGGDPRRTCLLAGGFGAAFTLRLMRTLASPLRLRRTLGGGHAP